MSPDYHKCCTRGRPSSLLGRAAVLFRYGIGALSYSHHPVPCLRVLVSTAKIVVVIVVMEGFAALAVAVNVYDVFKMSTNVLKEAIQVYHSASGMPSEVQETQELYGNLSQLIDHYLTTDDYHNSEVEKVAARCKKACEDLQKRLAKLKVTSEGMRKLWESIWVMVRFLRYKEDIERQKTNIREYRQHIILSQSSNLRYDRLFTVAKVVELIKVQ